MQGDELCRVGTRVEGRMTFERFRVQFALHLPCVCVCVCGAWLVSECVTSKSL